MSDEQDKLRVSLEPPKLFGRKRKSRGDGGAEATDPTGADRADQPTEVLEDQPEADAAPPVVEPEPEPAVVPEPAPEPGPAVEPDPEPAPAPQRQQADATEPVRRATPAKVTAATPPTTPAKVTPATAPTTPAPAKKAVRPATKTAASAAPVRTPAPSPVAVEPEPVTDFAREDAEIAAAAQADDEPLLDRYPAAALTGGIVGLAAVSLIWLFLRGCEAVRGTSSCGGGPGLVLLLLTFAACVLLGSALLRTFLVSEPGTTSFLACGVVAAISLTFLVDLLDSWPIMVIVPLVAVAAYLGSVKLSELIDESADTT